jgi:hypothetical protein
MIKLESINLQGERCFGVDQSPRPNSSDLPVEITILGEHRFIILFAGTATSQKKCAGAGPNITALVERKGGNGNGELDVMSIDLALARMEDGNKSVGKRKSKGLR